MRLAHLDGTSNTVVLCKRDIQVVWRPVLFLRRGAVNLDIKRIITFGTAHVPAELLRRDAVLGGMVLPRLSGAR